MAGINRKDPTKDLAVIVDDSGRLQAQFGGPGAREEASDFLRETIQGGVQHLRGATVVEGAKALEAIQKGRL